MSDISELERRLIAAETKIEMIREGLNAPPPKKSWIKDLTSLSVTDWLSRAGFLLGLPVATVVAYEQFDSKVWNPGKYREIAERSMAVEKVLQLQQINEEIYVLQAEDKDNVAYAKLEARRGQVHRLTDDIYGLWQEYGDVYGIHEKYALAEALLLQSRTDDALAVVGSVAVADLDTIGQIDLRMLRARILFADGPAQNAEAAREELREAVNEAEALPRPGQIAQMHEKLLSVRVINELWLGTPCAEIAQMGGYLRELTQDGMPAEAFDAVRVNTHLVLETYDERCPAGG